MLGAFADGFASWRRVLAGGGTAATRMVLFVNCASEVAGYVARGLDRAEAADALTELAQAHGLVAHAGADGVQGIIAEAFEIIARPPGVETPSSRLTDGRERPDAEVVPDLIEPQWTNGRDQQVGALVGTEFAELSTMSRKVWCVHHLLAAGEISVWYGEPGSGKSIGLEDLGLHVAAGLPWQGRQTQQGAVLYLALERFSVVARRAIAWGIERDRSQQRLPFKVIRGPLDFRDPQIAPKVVAAALELGRRYNCQPGLIIVDTVSRALCGGDENSPKDMGGLILNAGQILAMGDLHIAMTHHQPADGRERMRGHGALLGAVDTTVHVVNKDGTRLAEVVKSSDHEEGQRMAFRLKSVTIDPDDGYGDPITAPVVVEEQMPTTAALRFRKPQPTGAAKLALNALHEAVATLGAVPPASNHIPPTVKAVTVEQWRDYTYRRGISPSDKPQSQQRAFQRAAQTLAAANLVGIWEPYVWSV